VKNGPGLGPGLGTKVKQFQKVVENVWQIILDPIQSLF
jgi:hypothetical protein